MIDYKDMLEPARNYRRTHATEIGGGILLALVVIALVVGGFLL